MDVRIEVITGHDTHGLPRMHVKAWERRSLDAGWQDAGIVPGFARDELLAFAAGAPGRLQPVLMAVAERYELEMIARRDALLDSLAEAHDRVKALGG